MDMSRYELIQQNKEMVLKFMKSGIMPLHILDWKVIYEAYLAEMEYEKANFKKPRKTAAAGTVAERYRTTERTVYNIIKFMENN